MGLHDLAGIAQQLQRALAPGGVAPAFPIAEETAQWEAAGGGAWARTGGAGTITLEIGSTVTVKVDHRTTAAPEVELGVTFGAPNAPVLTLPAGVSYVLNAPPTVIGAESLLEGEAFSVDITNDSGEFSYDTFAWLWEREGWV